MNSESERTSWVKHLTKSKDLDFLIRTFGAAPSVQGIRLVEVCVLFANRRDLSLRFNLREFPNPPPKGWEKYDTVQVTLECLNLTELQAGQVIWGELSDLSILKVDDEVHVSLVGGMLLECRAQHVALTKLSVH
jgi:Immunity protein 50